MAKRVLTTGLLALSLLFFVTGLITFAEDFKRVGLSLNGVGGVGLLVWLFLFVRRTQKEIESLRAAAGAGSQDARSRLEAIYQRLESLMNTWEGGHPAGAEAWRAEVSGLSQKAEQIIRTEYSPEEAARFRNRKIEDAREYRYYIERSLEIDDFAKRELMLDAKLKFIFELLHGSHS